MATFDYQSYYTQAVWYAFGRQDESFRVHHRQTAVDAHDFAKAYADHVKAFREGRVFTRALLHEAYEAFSRGETLPGSGD